MRNKPLNFWKKIAVFAIMLLFIPLFGTVCGADAGDEDLAQQYAPILYFEKNENCYPVDVSYHLENSYLKAFGDQYADISIKATEVNFSGLSSIASQLGLSENDLQYAYLDNEKGTVDDDNIINDYKSSNLGYKVYSHVETSGIETVIQYWMFYAFNKGNLNQHEGDWEMVQVTISAGIPTEVAYSQHHGGQRATWGQVEKDDENHIKVYVARGSHANYLRYYSGKFGIASDHVGKNGKILDYNDYTLELLESQDWLSFSGMWGEFSDVGDLIMGRTGPQGPQYRENEVMWKNWGGSLTAANDNIFLVEWLIYHFVMLFLIFSAIFLAITGFRIYRRHKKYGLGPRIVSMLYIDGPNLKSIGNILCFVGIIIVFFALFNPWYNVSYAISGDPNFATFETEGMTDLLSIDGINGIQLVIPGTSGPTPVGTLSLPFSFFIAVGIIFLVLATIGIHKSGKLGKKYLFKGIRFLIPVILVIVVMFVIGSLISSMAGSMIPEAGSGSTIENAAMSVLDKLKSSPYGGQGTIPISEEGISGQIDLQWGLGSGMQFLLFAGVIMIVAGVLELAAKTEFFECKAYEKPKKEKKKKKNKKKKEKQDNKVEEIIIPKSEEVKEEKKE